MSKKFVPEYYSDMTDRLILPGKGGTTEFGLEGVRFEMELLEGEVRELRAMLKPYTDRARVVGRSTKARAAANASRRGEPPVQVNAKKQAASTEDAKARREKVTQMRRWAKANGHDINARGRIPEDVESAYDKAVAVGNVGLRSA